MEEWAKLVTAFASLAWPLVIGILLLKLYVPIRTLVESGRNRKFSIKVAGNELTMEEVSEQQRTIISDLQRKVAELEKIAQSTPGKESIHLAPQIDSKKRILWVDDSPKNNSFLVAALEDRGVRVDIATTTDEGVAMFKKSRYDIVLSDIKRPEGELAGIDFTRIIKSLNSDTPIFIFCGSWAANNLRAEALGAGATEITSSGTTLLSLLPLTDED
jgi:CheY-like chemotaxis protein